MLHSFGGLTWAISTTPLPIIEHDDARRSPTHVRLAAVTRPGCLRTVHPVAGDGRSYDALGPTTADPHRSSAQANALLRAAAQRRVPITMLDPTRPKRPHYAPWKARARALISMSPGEAMRRHLIRSGWSNASGGWSHLSAAVA